MDPAYQYRGLTARVIDGDTYELDIDLGFRVSFTINGRLHGVDCPELSTEAGKQAKAWVESILRPDGKPIQLVVVSYKDRQTFARWVVDIYLPDDVRLTDKIIEAGQGKPFMA